MGVRIEFIKETHKRQVGEQIVVDSNSAKFLVDEDRVAKYVDVGEPETPTPAPVADDVTPPTGQRPDDGDPVVTVDGEQVDDYATEAGLIGLAGE